MNSFQEMVTEFHRTYGAPVGAIPAMITRERHNLRKGLIEEELIEYLIAYEKNDVVEVADALGDLLYVVIGTAVEYGIDLTFIVAEIHRSNMSKLGEDGQPIYREDGKVLKGPNFALPDLASIIQFMRVANCSMCLNKDHWCDKCDAQLDHDGNCFGQANIDGSPVKHIHEL